VASNAYEIERAVIDADMVIVTRQAAAIEESQGPGLRDGRPR
jgi:hypothetical protein